MGTLTGFKMRSYLQAQGDAFTPDNTVITALINTNKYLGVIYIHGNGFWFNYLLNHSVNTRILDRLEHGVLQNDQNLSREGLQF